MSDFTYNDGTGTERFEMIGEHIVPCLTAIEVLQSPLSSVHHLTVFHDPYRRVFNNVQRLVFPGYVFLGKLLCQSLPVFTERREDEDTVGQDEFFPKIITQSFSTSPSQPFVERSRSFRRSTRKDLDTLQHYVRVALHTSNPFFEPFQAGSIVHIGKI